MDGSQRPCGDVFIATAYFRDVPCSLKAFNRSDRVIELTGTFYGRRDGQRDGGRAEPKDDE